MYKALYRKYRPMTFDDVVSQHHITTTLRNQLVSGKTAHAYLFTGSRGTGKTTCARILAKALNCLDPKNGEPCLECEICRDAENGALSDVIEIDAASNNGVDDIRDLRDGTVYTPERCKYKVYIIDEVHMLSPGASNALLKIMEEPPPHVKFILATTEIHKILPTILSRCQRYDFRRILPADITERLMYIAEKENISLDREAAELIAKTADGGMRDALSLLDRCIAFSDSVTTDTVSAAAGIAGREHIFDIMEAAAGKDPVKAIEVVNSLYNMSKDMQKLCDELISQFRNVMLAKAVGESEGLLACMPGELERIRTLSEQLSLDEIMDILDILQTSNERIARVASKRVELEMCLLKLCTRTSQKNAPPDKELTEKLDMLERQLEAVKSAQSTSGAANTVNAVPPKPVYSRPEAVSGGAELSKLKPEDFVREERWQEILEKFAEICPSVNGALGGSYAVKGGGYMLVFAENSFFLQLLRNKENAEKLREAVKLITGQTYSIRAKCTSKQTENGGGKLSGILDKARQNNVPVDSDTND